MNITEQDQAYLYHQETKEIQQFFLNYQNINLTFEVVNQVVIPYGISLSESCLKKVEDIVSHKIMARKLVFVMSEILKNQPFLKSDQNLPACFKE